MTAKRIGLSVLQRAMAATAMEAYDGSSTTPKPAAAPAAAPAEAPTAVATETIETAEPVEVVADANQDEVPRDGDNDAPVEELPPVAEAIAEAAAPEAVVEEEEVVVDPDAPEMIDEEVDLIDVIQDIGDLRSADFLLQDDAEDLLRASRAVVELQDLADDADSMPEEADNDSTRAVVELAVEGIYQRLGMENPAIALEDAAGLGATLKEKVSSIREQVIRLFRAIIESIKRAYERARDYLKRVFEVAARVEKAAATLRSQVRSMQEGQVGPGDVIANMRLTHALGTPKDMFLLEAFENMGELVKEAHTSANSGYIDYLNTLIDDFVEGRGGAERLINNFPRVLARALDECFTHDASNAEFDVQGNPEQVQILTSDLMPGGFVGVLCLPKTVADLRFFEYNVVRTDKAEREDLAVMNKKEMLYLLEIIIKTVSLIRKYERDARSNGTLVDKLHSAIGKLESQADVEVSAEDREFLKALSAMAPALARGIHERTFSYAVDTCANAVRYVAASASRHEVGETADTAADRMKKDLKD